MALEQEEEHEEDGERGEVEEEEEEVEEKDPNFGVLLSRLGSATKHTSEFLSQNDLTLHPSQTLLLESLLLSSASSISTLHSHTQSPQPPHPHPSTPPPPPPPPSSSSSPSSYWYLRFLASSSPHHWLETFHMTRTSFYLLLQILTPSLYSSPLPPPDHKLAAALFRLAHAAPLRTLARLFGFQDSSSASRAFHEVCLAISDRLHHRTSTISSDHQQLLPPHCGGVVGYSRFGPIVAQVVVVADGTFLDVSAGWSAELSPCEILPRSRIFSDLADLTDRGGHHPYKYLLGDSCCPLLPSLLTPFEGKDVEERPAARVFNDAHSLAMEIARNALWEIRVRWGLLAVGLVGEEAEVEEERRRLRLGASLPFVVVAGCLLHNFLVRRGESLPVDGGTGKIKEVSDALGVFERFKGKGVNEEGRRVRESVALQMEATRVGNR